MVDKKKILIILQARMSSTRLPGKALLTIKGLPIACLAAKRATNSGIKLIAATSTDPSDDPLVKCFAEYGIDYYRGSLSDVYSRFSEILNTVPEDLIIVRLTADNVFPDGKLIERVVESLGELDIYKSTDMVKMPYGLSIEVFRNRAFKSLSKENLTAEDHEHVTPSLRKKSTAIPYSHPDYSQHFPLRCTIDYLKDYQDVSEIFESVSDPINVDSAELTRILYLKKFSPNRFCLGTAQLGIEGYGISNISGIPSLSESFKILNKAFESGVRYIDTANAYGLSEKVLGEFTEKSGLKFKMCTKITPALDYSSEEAFVNSIEKSFDESLSNLKTNTIHTVLFHRYEHLEKFDSIGLRKLQEFKKKGLVNSIGISLSNPDELQSIQSLDEIDHIQLPYNFLDNRWDQHTKLLEDLSIKLRIHTRSIFLQGMVFADKMKKVPVNLLCLDQLKKFLHEVESTSGININTLAIAYAQSQSWIDQLVVGNDSVQQVNENIKIFESNRPLLQDLVNQIKTSRPYLSDDILDPAKWRFE